MSVAVLPVVSVREQHLINARRRGVRHLAVAGHPPSYKSDPLWASVQRSKSEQRLPQVSEHENACTDVGHVSLEDKKDRIKALVAAVESQRPSVAFSGHKGERRRPGSGSSLGSRSVSYHSLCAVQESGPVKVVEQPAAVKQTNLTKPKKLLRNGVVSVKAPTINFAPVRSTT